MITVDQAEAIIKKTMPSWGKTDIRVDELSALHSAENLIADRAYPSIHRATMDGIAVAWEEWSRGTRAFPIAGLCPAGVPEKTLSDPTSAMEIMTGAALPKGATLVIPYEHLAISHSIASVKEDHHYTAFENVHLFGSDFTKDTVLLGSQRLMNGPRWGIAASLGYETLSCYRSPKIKVISTGDELIAVGQKPEPHQVRRSNSYAIKASLIQNGFSAVELDHLVDDEHIVAQHYEKNRNDFDVLIYSGGVSKGKFDYLPKVWRESGVTKHFHEVSQRPGKPLWYGVDETYNTAVFGLPGNPISSLVCLHRYFILQRPMHAKLTADVVFKKDLSYFVPVALKSNDRAELEATPILAKNSGEFSVLAESDGFIELPKEKSLFTAGECYKVFLWTWLW